MVERTQQDNSLKAYRSSGIVDLRMTTPCQLVPAIAAQYNQSLYTHNLVQEFGEPLGCAEGKACGSQTLQRLP